jgi:hypothetical protein
MKLITYLFFSLILFSCSQRTTKEQRDKFENCRKNISGLSGLVIQFEIEATYGKQGFTDMFELNLEEFITKYDIPIDKVDSILEHICQNGEFEKHPIEYENIIYEKYDVDSDTILNKRK